MTESDLDLIQRHLRIDLTDPTVRQRAWRRLHVFGEIAHDCDAEGNPAMAETLRRICRRATRSEPDVLCLALLAGLDLI